MTTTNNPDSKSSQDTLTRLLEQPYGISTDATITPRWGTTSLAGAIPSVVAFVLALIAYIGGARDEVTLGALASGVVLLVSTLHLRIRQIIANATNDTAILAERINSQLQRDLVTDESGAVLGTPSPSRIDSRTIGNLLHLRVGNQTISTVPTSGTGTEDDPYVLVGAAASVVTHYTDPLKATTPHTDPVQYRPGGHVTSIMLDGRPIGSFSDTPLGVDELPEGENPDPIDHAIDMDLDRAIHLDPDTIITDPTEIANLVAQEQVDTAYPAQEVMGDFDPEAIDEDDPIEIPQSPSEKD